MKSVKQILLEAAPYRKGAGGNALFLNRKGLVVSQGTKHISSIIKSPELYGLTSDIVKERFEHYNERIGTEKNARRDLIMSAIDNGYARVRRYKDYWSINIDTLPKWKDGLSKWAADVEKADGKGYMLYANVKLFVVKDDKMIEMMGGDMLTQDYSKASIKKGGTTASLKV